MTEPLPPLCIDCRFHEQLFRFGDRNCKRWPEETRIARSPVTGHLDRMERSEPCRIQRTTPNPKHPADRCGPEGKYFQPKGDAGK